MQGVATGIATEQEGTDENAALREGTAEVEKANKKRRKGMRGDSAGWQWENFKTGALNHSATLPAQ
jgi:hypothetical protein